MSALSSITPILIQLPLDRLYNAQTTALKSIKLPWFPAFDSRKLAERSDTFTGKVLIAYQATYDCVSYLNAGVKSGWGKTTAGVSLIASYVFNPVLNRLSLLVPTHLKAAVSYLYNTIYPINPANGYRHLQIIPRAVEKFIGEWIFYPLYTLEYSSSTENAQGLPIHEVATDVLDRLVEANQKITHPESETTRFNYSVWTVNVSQINAFALPSGKIVLFDKIVKVIENLLPVQTTVRRPNGEFYGATNNFSKITLADGSKVVIDVSEVNLQASLAALLGHEATHAAARHGIGSLTLNYMVSLIGLMLRGFAIEGARRLAPGLSPESLEALDELLEGIQEWIEYFIDLFSSRAHEYEADITGLYMSLNAGYNPLGALKLQDVLEVTEGPVVKWFHKNLEFLFTHPYAEHRKRALLAAIVELCPEALDNKIHSFERPKNSILDREKTGASTTLSDKLEAIFAQNSSAVTVA